MPLVGSMLCALALALAPASPSDRGPGSGDEVTLGDPPPRGDETTPDDPPSIDDETTPDVPPPISDEPTDPPGDRASDPAPETTPDRPPPPLLPPPVDDAEEDDDFGDDADDEPWPEDDDAVTDDAPEPDYDPLRDSPQAVAATHWIRTGIGVMSAGGALVIGAIVMGASDPCNPSAGNSCQLEARNRAALVMGVPGAVLVGAGAAALGVGMHRRHRIALDLQASRHGLGLALRGRF